VCYLRLDFENFDINGLTASDENPTGTMGATTTNICTDKFTITVSYHYFLNEDKEDLKNVETLFKLY
jgi:hypothetical protein